MHIDHWVKFLVHGVELAGVDNAAIRVTHLLMVGPALAPEPDPVPVPRWAVVPDDSDDLEFLRADVGTQPQEALKCASQCKTAQVPLQEDCAWWRDL